MLHSCFNKADLVTEDSMNASDTFNLSEAESLLPVVDIVVEVIESVVSGTSRCVEDKTRKKVEDTKTEHKKTQLSTIKNYLKEKNLIKFGTTAPSKLLREMFETSELCGGILNKNKDVLIHNFDK